jgi:hypothetical protein
MLRKLGITTALVLALAIPAVADDNQQYHVDVYMSKITCVKAVEGIGDTQEDLYGNIVIKSLRYPADEIGGTKYDGKSAGMSGALWNQGASPSLVLGTGQSRSFSNFIRLTGLNALTKTQVLGLEFGVGGVMKDWEPISITFKECDQCGGGQRIMRLSSWASQIEGLARGGSRYLQIGSDDTFQLDWYEGDANSAHVRALMKIKITRL